jgi:hypothetical protein
MTMPLSTAELPWFTFSSQFSNIYVVSLIHLFQRTEYHNATKNLLLAVTVQWFVTARARVGRLITEPVITARENLRILRTSFNCNRSTASLWLHTLFVYACIVLRKQIRFELNHRIWLSATIVTVHVHIPKDSKLV